MLTDYVFVFVVFAEPYTSSNGQKNKVLWYKNCIERRPLLLSVLFVLKKFA